MAAEALGAVVGVVGVLGQLFDGCVKAYGYFTTATHLDQESQRLLCKVRIEEMRLVVWGRGWGVAEGHLEAHLSNPQMRELATNIMRNLHATVTDFKLFQEKYGLTESPASGGQTSDAKPGKAVEEPASKNHGKGAVDRGDKLMSTRSWRKEISLRAKWVIADKEKFSKLLIDLKDFNDALERFFPASRLESLHRAWRHELLESAQRDVGELSLLETASDGVYQQLNTSAGLKKLRINLDTQPQATFKPTFAFKVQRNLLNLPDEDPQRVNGFHQTAGDAIIEWVDYDKEAHEERFVHLRRLDDLARMMHSASERHPDLHTIDCLGYTDDTGNSRYGLVYKAPAPSFSTLHTLISSNDLKTPDLGERVRLAHTLAVALWSLHSLDWLHKSLCSNNILFFPSAFSASATKPTATAALVPDISKPFLVGFDASRPDMDTEMSVASKNPSILDLHRHPASLKGLSRKPYCKSYDIYSLGLVLLEIGLWKVLQTFYKPHYSAERWRDKIILPVLVPGLGSKVGRLYREVVDKCLGANEDMSSHEAGQLMESVVAALESIRV